MNTFKDIPFDDSYQINHNSEVYSKKTDTVLKQSTRRGYPTVILCKNSIKSCHSVHRLVAATFLGDIKGKVVMHLDDIKTNNNIKNLKIGSQSDNIKDMHSKGRGADYRGDKSHRAILSDGKVFLIRKLYQTGHYTYRRLSNIFNVGKTAIGQVVTHQTWKHITQHNA